MLSDLLKLSRKEKFIADSVFFALCFISLVIWILSTDDAELSRHDKILFSLISSAVGIVFELCTYISYRSDTKKCNDFIDYGRRFPSEDEQLRLLTVEEIAKRTKTEGLGFEELAETYNDEPMDYDFIVGLTKFAGVCRRSDPEEWYAMLSAGENIREFTLLSLKFFSLHPEAIRFQKLCEAFDGDTLPFREYFGVKSDKLERTVIDYVREHIRDFDY